MADNPELAVVHRIPRKSGSTTYILNTKNKNTVFHSRHGSLCCMDPTCSGVYKEGDPRYKGCEHTRVVKRYAEANPETDDTPAIERSETGAPPVDDDVDEDYQ